jgi:hypothetical protein
MAKQRSREAGQVASRKPLSSLDIPSGLPPVHLPGKKITKEVILTWAQETREVFGRSGKFLKRRGLLYLIDMYFIDPNDESKLSAMAEKVLETLPDEIPQSS